MSKTPVIQKLEDECLKKDLPSFASGDTVKIHHRIVEGDKERTQIIEGTVMGTSGNGLTKTVLLHRVSYGVVMEHRFLIHSPRVAKIEVIRKGRVRRSKLTYLRGKKGKKAKVKGQIVQAKKKKAKKSSPDGANAQAVAEHVQTEPVLKEENLPAEVATTTESAPPKE